jgi:hypothetical protein
LSATLPQEPPIFPLRETDVFRNGEYQWSTTQAIPVDATGASMAGLSEASQESTYTALDQTIFGANRSAPTALDISEEYASSFINSTDEEVSPGIGSALIHLGVNQATIPLGTVITVTFPDGTTAEFVRISTTSSYQWGWNGVAHNANKQLIDRSGNVIPIRTRQGQVLDQL